MDKRAEYIREGFQVFTKITTWTLFAAACFITVFWGNEADIGVGLLWQILGLALVCTLGAMGLVGRTEGMGKKQLLLRYLLCYIFINGVIITGGLVFEWFYLSDWKMVASMLVLIALGFLAITWFGFRAAKREAALMNEKLKEQNK